ncbi:hypothetical protein CEXT_394691 [Caerostris extrusa]|uniref:Uncharacterized protein n=1 Tax=Caerostris extrusa TaxID=172846 RepID=A0AAV4UHT7_CAEEX|nr:hypothetical protein CEXT_394691 [Caerostris extrusa]
MNTPFVKGRDGSMVSKSSIALVPCAFEEVVNGSISSKAERKVSQISLFVHCWEGIPGRDCAKINFNSMVSKSSVALVPCALKEVVNGSISSKAREKFRRFPCLFTVGEEFRNRGEGKVLGIFTEPSPNIFSLVLMAAITTSVEKKK